MSATVAPPVDPTEQLERKGRKWIFGSLVFCPCHLPVTLAILVTVLGGTAFGAFLSDNLLLAGLVVTVVWVAGTWRGFRLVRQAKLGACPVPAGRGPSDSPD